VALNILAEVFPKREVIGIDCVDLVWGLGTLHCMTQQQPAAHRRTKTRARGHRNHGGGNGMIDDFEAMRAALAEARLAAEAARYLSARWWFARTRLWRGDRIGCCAMWTLRRMRRLCLARGGYGNGELSPQRLHALCDAGAVRDVRRAMIHARLDRLVFAAADPKAGRRGQ